MPSRSLDYSGSRTGNYLRFGQPLFYYSVDRKHELFQGHKETGRERDLLIGMLGEGEQEHLVVFSDEEFERGYTKIREKNEENLPILREQGELAWEQYLMEHEDNLTDGPTNLILWDVPKEPVSYTHLPEACSPFQGSPDDKYCIDCSWNSTLKIYRTHFLDGGFFS